MLNSVKISQRQSKIRQDLAALVGKEEPTEEETRAMEGLDKEYQDNEVRYRASLIAEDEERQEASEDLETRSDKEWSKMMDGFELRQVALAIDEGQVLDGATNEIVTELRSGGGYRGFPVPWEALEMRAGETVAAGVPDPIRTAPIIERLFAGSVAAKMGGRMINIGVGEMEYPVTTSSVSAGWTTSETGDVPGPSAYATVDRPMAPDHNLGIQMELTRKSMKQTGNALEQAVRRDMNGAISEAMDKAVFQGSGSAGEPTGLLAGASGWGITETAVDAAATWAAFRDAVTRFMTANAASGPDAVKLLLRPEVFNNTDDLISGLAISEWDRISSKIKNIVMSSNALADPTGDPLETTAILTTNIGGVAPFFVGAWGAIDLIRDPYTKAASGSLQLTALTTMDVTVSRTVQTEILTGIQ